MSKFNVSITYIYRLSPYLKIEKYRLHRKIEANRDYFKPFVTCMSNSVAYFTHDSKYRVAKISDTCVVHVYITCNTLNRKKMNANKVIGEIARVHQERIYLDKLIVIENIKTYN